MKLPSLRRPRRGNSAIEFALWVAPLVMIVSGIVDLSFYMARLNNVVRAARDAARVASVVDDPDTGAADWVPGKAITDAASKHASWVLAQAGLPCGSGACTITSTWTKLPIGGVGDRWVVRVQIRYPAPAMVGLIPALGSEVGGDFTMMTQDQSDE